MATVTLLKSAFVSLDGTEYTTQVKQVAIEMSNEAQDKTAMGNDTRIRTGGLKDWSMNIDFFQLSSTLDSTLFNALGSTVALIVRASTPAAGSTNPQYSGTGLLESFNPIAGTVGELQMVSARFTAASSMTRT